MFAGIRPLFTFSVRVRYAPSPTGPMHLGAVRTALFNYMFAQKNEGKFILRIQDTDIARNVQNGQNQILDTLEWIGIKPHESFRAGGPYGPYIQSQRRQLYNQIEKQLIKNGYAYPCFCPENPNKSKEQQGYDGKCRNLSVNQIVTKIKNGQKYVVRIKSDIKQLQIDQFKDQIFGKVTANKFDDFIITKRNRWPTYHFANVIDDWKMQISHVIRGAQWLTNTPKHIYLYRILGAKLPIFMHLPLIFTADGKKLSKRDPTAPINSLKALGYQPEAILNYTGLMGHNLVNNTMNENDEKPIQPIKQFFNLKELIQGFQMNQVSNSPIRSDPKKLNFFNRHYLRQKWRNQKQHPQISLQFRSFIRSQLNIDNNRYSDEYLNQVVECILERINNFEDMKEYQYFFMNAPKEYNQKDLRKIFGSETTINEGNKLEKTDELLHAKNLKILHNLRLIFQHILSPEEFSEQKIAQKISEYLYDNRQFLKNQDVYHLLRLAITGRKSGVSIVKTCTIIGRERVIQNLTQLYTMLQKPQQMIYK